MTQNMKSYASAVFAQGMINDTNSVFLACFLLFPFLSCDNWKWCLTVHIFGNLNVALIIKSLITSTFLCQRFVPSAFWSSTLWLPPVVEYPKVAVADRWPNLRKKAFNHWPLRTPDCLVQTLLAGNPGWTQKNHHTRAPTGISHMSGQWWVECKICSISPGSSAVTSEEWRSSATLPKFDRTFQTVARSSGRQRESNLRLP